MSDKFITVTKKSSNKKMIVNVSRIAYVEDGSKVGSLINFSGQDKDYEAVTETVDEVHDLINGVSGYNGTNI